MTNRNVVVVAGAGTGKTHALVETYLECLLGLDEADDGADAKKPRSPEQILAITFTEKAAAEMRARVQRRLGDLLFHPDKEPDLAARVVDVDARLLESVRRAVSGAPIHTFHAFCARVLRDHALAAELDPAFTILEPDDERRLLAETAESCVIDALQREGASDDAKHLVAELVARVALHGFGERKGLVECLVDLHGTLAERGLDAAALSLAADASLDVDTAFDGVTAAVGAVRALATGNGAARCAFVAQAKTALAGAWADKTGDLEARIAHAYGELREVAGGNWGGNRITEERKKLVVAVEALGAAFVDAFTRDLAPVVRALLADLDDRQRREKQARGFLAFGDLLVRTRDLLASNPSVRARVKARFKRILVDEYQDTSPVQEDVLALLLEGPRTRGPSSPSSSAERGPEGEAVIRSDPADGPDLRPREAVNRSEPVDGPALRPREAIIRSGSAGRNDAARVLGSVDLGAGRAFLVGDPKQSIYGFRGADSGVFTRALDVVAAAPLGERRELAECRRSLAPVVDVANLVASVALPRGPFGVDPSQLVPLVATRGGEGAAGEHWRAADASSDSDDDAGPSLTPHEQESLIVAKRLRELFDAGAHAPGDVAILVRRGKAAVPLARALGRAGIPSVVVGGDGFYVRPEITDVVAALTLAADPSDEVAVLTVLRSPLVGLPDDEILALYAQLPKLRGLTWEKALVASTREGVAADTRERLRSFDAVLTTVKQRLHQPSFERTGLARAVDALLDDGGYAAACAVESDAELRLRNLEKLRALVELQRESALVTLARLANAVDEQPPEPLAAVLDAAESSSVRIMTIHQAKGLEFPVVVLADAGSGLRGESDDVCFDAAAGLAVTARGRPIAACVQKSSRATAGLTSTAIQRVRRKLRERNECELARLLYVAVTRARDKLYVVGAPRRNGTGSLLGILDSVRAADTPRFDTLLPRIDVVPSAPRSAPLPAPLPAPSTPASAPLEALPALAPSSRRVRASDLGAALDRQLGMLLSSSPTLNVEGIDEADRLPPRAAGRLAHAILALVAQEAPSSILDQSAPSSLAAVVARAARACGVTDAPQSLLDRCASTLAGPVRALLASSHELSFEELLWLEADGVVVEGKADLVARSDAGVVVVELKLTDARARGDAAQLQVSAYAAALAQREGRPIHVATWALGDASPAAPQAFGKSLKAKLDRALAAVRL